MPHKLEINMTFETKTRAQAKYIAKQIARARHAMQKIHITQSSRMNSTIRKED